MKHWEFKASKQTVFLAILGTLSLSLLTGCQDSLESVCNDQFPKFDQKLTNAVLALEPWTQEQNSSAQGQGPRRKLASIQNDLRKQQEEVIEVAEDQEILMSRADRQSWQNWSVELLDETQGAIDTLSMEPRLALLAKDLQEVANLIVRLNGYAQLGDARKMTTVIDQIKAKSQAVAKAGCRL